MSANERSVLSLKSRPEAANDGGEERSVPVGLFDVQLPSRWFVIHHKVAELGQVSLTAEFLLRLLYSIDGMPEEYVATFFGFNQTEMAFVVGEAESRAYVYRRDGKIWLSEAGYALFKDGDKPQIFEVDRRVERVGFDLLSLAPCEKERLSDFEMLLPELSILDEERAAAASQFIPDAFRRHYSEISPKRERDSTVALKRSLYSVDQVTPADRFMSVVPVLAKVNTRRPTDPEPVLDAWKAGHELADRSAVVHSVAAFLANLKVSRTIDHEDGFRALTSLAPDYLGEYVTREGLNAARYFREIAGRAGELRADRPTIGLAGPIYGPENADRLLEALRYSIDLDPKTPVTELLWALPTNVHWGMTRALPKLLERLQKHCTNAIPNGGHLSVLALNRDKPPRALTKVFDQLLLQPTNCAIPSSVEMLLIPRRLVALVVHAPIGREDGFPIPLGLLSFDPKVIRRAHSYLCSNLPKHVDTTSPGGRFDLEGLVQWGTTDQE
jgi:hypothetical protein